MIVHRRLEHSCTCPPILRLRFLGRARRFGMTAAQAECCPRARNGTDRCPCARSRSMERHDALTLHAPGSTREYVNVDVDGHSRRAYVKLRGQRV